MNDARVNSHLHTDVGTREEPPVSATPPPPRVARYSPAVEYCGNRARQIVAGLWAVSSEGSGF